jgi:hypothetical protein
MANIEPIPSVIDFERILQPISEDNPSGESLQYSGLYDEIREARRADKDLPQGQWQTELKVADYRQVISLAVPALETQTKDLQIAAWLSESLIKEYEFAGLRDSLKLLNGLQENFWDTIYRKLTKAIWKVALTPSNGWTRRARSPSKARQSWAAKVTVIWITKTRKDLTFQKTLILLIRPTSKDTVNCKRKPIRKSRYRRPVAKSESRFAPRFL